MRMPDCHSSYDSLSGSGRCPLVDLFAAPKQRVDAWTVSPQKGALLAAVQPPVEAVGNKVAAAFRVRACSAGKAAGIGRVREYASSARGAPGKAAFVMGPFVDPLE